MDGFTIGQTVLYRRSTGDIAEALIVGASNYGEAYAVVEFNLCVLLFFLHGLV